MQRERNVCNCNLIAFIGKCIRMRGITWHIQSSLSLSRCIGRVHRRSISIAVGQMHQPIDGYVQRVNILDGRQQRECVECDGVLHGSFYWSMTEMPIDVIAMPLVHQWCINSSFNIIASKTENLRGDDIAVDELDSESQRARDRKIHRSTVDLAWNRMTSFREVFFSIFSESKVCGARVWQ